MTPPVFFISSVFGLVDVDHAIGAELRRRGHTVRWIVSRRESAATLRGLGVEDAAIMNLSVTRSDVRRSMQDSSDDGAAHLMAQAFGPTGDAYRFLMVDRFAARWKGRARLHYGGILARRIRAALDGETRFAIVCEPSSLTDWFLYLYATQRRQLLCSLHTVRYPSGRVGLFEGIDDSKLLPFRNAVVKETKPSMRSVLESRPEYYALDSGSMGKRRPWHWPARIRLLQRNSDEMADFSLKERVQRRLQRVLQREYIDKVFRFDEPDTARPYVLFPLQVQPEMSVDVHNPEFRDQLRTATVLRRLLSPDFDLLVKEHQSQLGCRGPGFLRELRRIPDVRIVSHKVDGRTLAGKAAAVVSVSGTMLLEAAMVGVPALALSNIFFGVHEGVRIVRNVDELAAELKRLPVARLSPERLDAANHVWLDWVAARSRQAEYGELIYYGKVLDPANIRVLADVLIDATEGWQVANSD